MSEPELLFSFLTKLNALTGGVFLLCAFGLVAIRQMLTCLRLYIFQSLLLAISAVLIGYHYASIHLFVVAALTIITKVFLIPWVLRQSVGYDSFSKREISQALNIPTTLLLSAAITIFAYYIASPLLTAAGAGIFEKVNLPIGMASLLIGAYTVTVRGEAVPQLLGILAMENGAFFAGISIAPSLPLIAELAAAFYVLITVLVIGLLAMRIHTIIAKTAVGKLMALRED
jgi:hydrogenase-4 component E